MNCFYFQNLDIFKYALVIGLHLEVRGKGGDRGGGEVRVHSFALVTQNICLALPHSPGKGSKGRRRERERNGERLKKEKQPKVSPKHLLLSLRMIRRRGRRRNTGDFAVNWGRMYLHETWQHQAAAACTHVSSPAIHEALHA